MMTCEHGKMPIKLCTCWQIWLDPHDFLARDPTDLSLCDQKYKNHVSKEKEKSYQNFLNVTQLEPGLDKLRIFHPTPLPHLVKTRCCQAHGLCFLWPFLCLLVEVERNLRMLEVVTTNLYIATKNPEVTLLTCWWMMIITLILMKNGNEMNRIYVHPRSCIFGSRNEHKTLATCPLGPRLSFYFNRFNAVAASAMIRNWCLSSDKIMVVNNIAVRSLWILKSLFRGVGGLWWADWWPLPRFAKSIDHLAAFSANKLRCHLKTTSALNWITCQVWFAIRYVWCIGRKAMDLLKTALLHILAPKG